MLISVSDLDSKIKNLPTATDPITGATNFANLISDFMGQVQAGASGSPGILTYNIAPAIALLAAMPPTPGSTWAPLFANAIASGVETGLITPGTVTNPIWLGSALLDVATLPTPVATIVTLSVAQTLFISELATITTTNSPMPMAQAIHDYVSAFVFLTIGLGVAPTFIPIPLPFNAQ